MNKIIAIIAALFCFTSCNDKVDNISFCATLSEQNTYEVGSKTTFHFNGNPDYITFYSGEKGHKYEYAGKVDDEGTANYGIPVKSMNARIGHYTYTYQTAGEYNAVFVVRNISFEGEKEQVVPIKITIVNPIDLL